MSDVTVTEYYLKVLLKASKTDKFDNYVKIIVGCSGHNVCAVCTMANYLQYRNKLFGINPNLHLSVHLSGLPLMCSVLNKHLKLSGRLHFNAWAWPTILLWPFAASRGTMEVAQNGLSDWEIKQLGRWSSEAYQRYIKLPDEFKISLAKRMIGST